MSTLKSIEQLEASLQRSTALIEAVRLISAQGHELNATLDALTEQTRLLFDAADVIIHLALPAEGEFLWRDTGQLARSESPLPLSGTVYSADECMRQAFALGSPLFVADYQGDSRISQEIKSTQPLVASSVVVPLIASGEREGELVLLWTSPMKSDNDQLAALEALGRHAAVAIRTQRLAEERARLDGAVKTGRLVAHELNNRLQVLIGYSGLLQERLTGHEAEMVGEITLAAKEMATLIARLNSITRFEETDFGGGAMLDLNAASTEPA